MAKHEYRVTRELPWIIGGKLIPGPSIEGGKEVVLQPGDTVWIDDREVRGVAHKLEALDEGGRAILEACRKMEERPARRVCVGELHPEAVEWLTRELEEKLRAQGKVRELCLRRIAAGDDPSREDLAAALEESEDTPQPPELLSYLAKMLRRKEWRKSGRKSPPRTTAEDLFIQSCYHAAVEELKVLFAHQKRPSIKTMAAEEVADLFDLGVRTVQRVVQERPLTKDGKRLSDI